MKFYSYYRSTAAYRVRIALNLKNIPHEMISIHLTKDGGRQHSPDYRAINPQGRVPSLVLSTGEVIGQSMAILEYLDEVYREPPLLPADAVKRAQVRAVAQVIACDIHPLNNLAPLNYLKGSLGHDQATVNTWYEHWIMAGFEAIEKMIAPGPYAFGPEITMADLFIVPQVYNARRFKLSLDRFPKILAVDAACQKLAVFDKARPEIQPDAE